MSDASHPLDGLLESASRPYSNATLVSIAISLKRIADALTNSDPYENPISRAIQNGLNEGVQDWIGHMTRNGR